MIKSKTNCNGGEILVLWNVGDWRKNRRQERPSIYRLYWLHLKTGRPGVGLSEAGAHSARWDLEVQRAFYNGWKSIHSLKSQTVDNFRIYDWYLWTFIIEEKWFAFKRINDHQNINDRMRNAGNRIVFGDSAYKDHHNCKCGDNALNHAMKSVRIYWIEL